MKKQKTERKKYILGLILGSITATVIIQYFMNH